MCIGLFYVGALVLVNTLIAMLVSRLTAVQENSDTEWKFGRTKMWLRFIEPISFYHLHSTSYRQPGSLSDSSRSVVCFVQDVHRRSKDSPRSTTRNLKRISAQRK
nr:short transient receptor potential channel 3-like [Lytechinus pictus]